MKLIEQYNEENIFKTHFSDSGVVIILLLVLSLIGLFERIIYDVTHIFISKIGGLGYFNNPKVITIHAIIILTLLLITILLNNLYAKKNEKYALAIIPYFIASIFLSLQLSLQLGVYFTNHHNNFQFYIVMTLLVFISSYSIFHIQNNYKKDISEQSSINGFLVMIFISIIVFAVLILSFKDDQLAVLINEQAQSQAQEDIYKERMAVASNKFLVNYPYPQIREDLSLGSVGQDVVLVNNVLSSERYMESTWLNGEFTVKTREALIRFQKTNGLEETGKVDKETLKLISEKLPSPQVSRIALHMGSINQYWDTASLSWKVDPSGRGADVSLLEYCKKWYPDTRSVKEYKFETLEYFRKGFISNGPYTVKTQECVI